MRPSGRLIQRTAGSVSLATGNWLLEEREMVEDVRRTGMRRFERKSVIVTGGASGIGEATAARFLSEGARVLIMDVSAQNIAAAASRLEGTAREFGGERHVYQGDVTQPDDVDA